MTRRRVIGSGVTAVAAVSGTAAALRPMMTARQTDTDAAPGGPGTAAATAPGTGAGGAPQAPLAPGAVPALFDEVYRGRRIQGFPDPGEDGVAIKVDGMPLQVMRRVDGSWISAANHYQPFTTPLATARGAVDVIGRAELSMTTEHHH
ncbi:tyrosinase family oxidase copper chaperone [Streptomyces sp. NBC_01198]|uniref:tyrosinase family oxidase copper chaperone n=1 Tax=Streptomyces sp. NBC_01198 TaxID=2903769 RepID=UPI002E0F7492|nr:tyrosinase cofactor [Streptomyces sp. NBC_01198]